MIVAVVSMVVTTVVTMVVAAIVAVVSAVAPPGLIAMVPSIVATASVALTLFVLAPCRNVAPVVPAILDEIDRPSAGVVLVAMPVPVALIAGRNVQIDRRGNADRVRRRCNQHRGAEDQLRRRDVA